MPAWTYSVRYKPSTEEWVVRFYKNGEEHKPARSYEMDCEDAHGTGKAGCAHMNAQEAQTSEHRNRTTYTTLKPYEELAAHIGHDLACVTYTPGEVSIECDECGCVVLRAETPVAPIDAISSSHDASAEEAQALAVAVTIVKEGDEDFGVWFQLENERGENPHRSINSLCAGIYTSFDAATAALLAVTGVTLTGGIHTQGLALHEAQQARDTGACPSCASLSPWRCGCSFLCPACGETEPESERGSGAYTDRCKDCEATGRKAAGKAGQ